MALLLGGAAIPANAQALHHTCTSGTTIYGSSSDRTASTHVESGTCATLQVRVELANDGGVSGSYGSWYYGSTDAVWGGTLPGGYTVAYGGHTASDYATIFITNASKGLGQRHPPAAIWVALRARRSASSSQRDPSIRGVGHSVRPRFLERLPRRRQTE